MDTALISQINNSIKSKSSRRASQITKEGKDDKDEKVVEQTTKLQNAIQNQLTMLHTGWTTNGHTGVDVNTYAYGPGSNKFKGNMENTQSAKTYLTFSETM